MRRGVLLNCPQAVRAEVWRMGEGTVNQLLCSAFPSSFLSEAEVVYFIRKLRASCDISSSLRLSSVSLFHTLKFLQSLQIFSIPINQSNVPTHARTFSCFLLSNSYSNSYTRRLFRRPVQSPDLWCPASSCAVFSCCLPLFWLFIIFS